jgi:hypothetical protein
MEQRQLICAQTARIFGVAAAIHHSDQWDRGCLGKTARQPVKPSLTMMGIIWHDINKGHGDMLPTQTTKNIRPGNSKNILPSVAKPRPRTAFLTVAGQDKGLACTLLDYTASGAVITLSGWLGVPERFSLYVEPEGRRHACRIVARKGNAVRVEFEEVTQP